MIIKTKQHELYPDAIIVRELEGCIGVTETIDSWKDLISQNIINERTKGIITDLTNCNLELDLDSYKIFIAYLRTQETLKRLKLAVISISPKTVVFPTLAQDQEKDLQVKPFSTMNAAVRWIMKE